MRYSMAKLTQAVALTTLTLAGSLTMAAEKWDMPMAYTDSNFHTQNGKSFAEAIEVATQGQLDVKVHGGGSLFKGSEIKRAVQTVRHRLVNVSCPAMPMKTPFSDLILFHFWRPLLRIQKPSGKQPVRILKNC